MKTSAKNLSLSALMLLTALFVGCNNSDNGDNSSNDDSSGGKTAGIIKPVPVSEVSDEAAAFFDENAYLITRDVFKGVRCPDGCCIMINSAEELPEVVGDNGSPLKYPVIDFDSNTLILGQFTTPHTGFYLMSQSLVAEQDAVVMNLVVGEKKGEVDFAQIIGVESLWGIYPKLTSKSIRTNVTYEE